MYHDLNSEKAVSLRLIYEDHPILSDLAISEITKEVDINSDSIDSTIEKYKKILVKLRQFEDFIERNNYCVKIVHLPDFTIILGEGEHLTTRKLDIYIKLITDKVQFIIDEIIKSHNKNEYIVNYFKKAFNYTLTQIKSLRNSDKYDNYEEAGSYAKECFIRIAEILFYVGKPHLNKVIDQIKNDIRIFNSSSDNLNDHNEDNIGTIASPNADSKNTENGLASMSTDAKIDVILNYVTKPEDKRLQIFTVNPPKSWRGVKIGFDGKNILINKKPFTYKELGLPEISNNDPGNSTTGLLIKILTGIKRYGTPSERKTVSQINKILKNITGLTENPIVGSGHNFILKFKVDNALLQDPRDDFKELPFNDGQFIDKDE